MSPIASQNTTLAIVYSTIYSGADQRKHPSSASLAFVGGIHRWPVNSPHIGPVTRKIFPFDDVIMSRHPLITSFLKNVFCWLFQSWELQLLDRHTALSWWRGGVGGWRGHGLHKLETIWTQRGQSLHLQWRHHEHDGVWNHLRLDRSLKRLFRRRSKKTSKLRVIGLCEGNSTVTGEFPAQRASNAENFSFWWRHHRKQG